MTKSGKERKWRLYKTRADLLADSYIRLGDFYRADKILDCGSVLKFRECASGHEKRLAWASFCKQRLCAMCAKRRSIKIAHQVQKVAHVLAQREKVRWLLLTLTVENVPGEELSDGIDSMMRAWGKMSRRVAFTKNVVGWTRSLEVTVERKRENYYHPHFHVVLAVKSTYFKNKEQYMTQADWTSLWKDCLKVQHYNPIVHITAVKNKRRNIARERELLKQQGFEIKDGKISELPPSVIAEVTKYTVKSDDYIVFEEDAYTGKTAVNEYKTDKHVKLLTKVLHGRRLFEMGLELKKIWNELEMQDVESDDVDLIHVNDELNECRCSVCGSDMLEKIYEWDHKKHNYYLRD